MRIAIALVSLLFAVSCAGLLLLSPSADPWEPAGAPARARPSARPVTCMHFDANRQAFFGDLHVHTKHSMDARSRDMLGTPDDAYRFARGEAIGIGPFDATGRGARQAQLERPLDFAAVTDHAEWIGEVGVCSTPGSPAYDSEKCQSYRGEIPFIPLLPVHKFLVGSFPRRLPHNISSQPSEYLLQCKLQFIYFDDDKQKQQANKQDEEGLNE